MAGKPNKKKPASKQRGKRKAGFSRRTLMSFVSVLVIAMFALAAPAFILMLVGMVPTIVALVVDREPEKYTAMSVAAANFAGVVPFVVELLVGNSTMSDAFAMLTDVFVMAVVYGAAGIGWCLIAALPSVTTVFMKLSADSKVMRLRGDQAKLVVEWGEDVAIVEAAKETA